MTHAEEAQGYITQTIPNGYALVGHIDGRRLRVLADIREEFEIDAESNPKVTANAITKELVRRAQERDAAIRTLPDPEEPMRMIGGYLCRPDLEDELAQDVLQQTPVTWTQGQAEASGGGA